MKHFPFINLFAALFLGCLLFSSCKPDHGSKKKPFKVATKTWYRVAPKMPEPINVSGMTYIGSAFFPGGGSGSGTVIGNCKTFFNQQTYGTSAEAPPSGSIAAPVRDVPGYPVSGGPLPLIQANDFSELKVFTSTLQIPATLQDRIINTVLYNSNGDAIFLSAITGSGATFPISETMVGFNGKALIMTGRGKFARATGEVNYDGYFNIVNANDATYNVDGWISY